MTSLLEIFKHLSQSWEIHRLLKRHA